MEEGEIDWILILRGIDGRTGDGLDILYDISHPDMTFAVDWALKPA